MLKWIEKYILAFEFTIHKSFMLHKINRYQSYFEGKILDVGAGDQPYRKLFTKTSNYISTNTKQHYNHSEEMSKFTDVWIKDASELPFKENEMDGLLCFQVLSVVEKPDLFFKETERILKPGGKLLLTTDFLYPTWNIEDRGRYSKQQLERLAVTAGLKVLKTESFGGIRSLFFSLLGRRIRSYPQRIKDAKSLITKMFRIVIFLFYLLFLPLISLSGYIIYLSDKNTKSDFDFTFNLLLFVEKPL